MFPSPYNQQLTVKFKQLTPTAKLPTAAHEYGDAGFDLYADTTITLPVGKATMVPTGLQLADCPFTITSDDRSAYFLDVRSRSGLSQKLVFPVTGTVDVAYRGEIKVILANLGAEDYLVKAGDRIAQLVIQKIMVNTPGFNMVSFEFTDKVVETHRGGTGFGSSGR